MAEKKVTMQEMALAFQKTVIFAEMFERLLKKRLEYYGIIVTAENKVFIHDDQYNLVRIWPCAGDNHSLLYAFTEDSLQLKIYECEYPGSGGRFDEMFKKLCEERRAGAKERNAKLRDKLESLGFEKSTDSFF